MLRILGLVIFLGRTEYSPILEAKAIRAVSVKLVINLSPSQSANFLSALE